MENFRIYGEAPYNVAVIHGGPGAAGEMAPVARELASNRGVLEPLQAATSIEGQVEELRKVLEEYGDLPVTLIGFSWGAWLSHIVAARFPTLVKKLILIGSGGFEEKYGAQTQHARLARLSDDEMDEYQSLIKVLNDPATEGKEKAFGRLGDLMSKVDTYSPLKAAYDESDGVIINEGIFHHVWRDADELRRSGGLLELGHHIECPVVAIHGDYDPHPAEGVREPLSGVLRDFRFILLKNCGHRPWIEKYAKEEFYEALKRELV